MRCALQDAASIAGLLITTEAMIAERPKEAPPPMPGAAAWAEWVAWAAWISDQTWAAGLRPSPTRFRTSYCTWQMGGHHGTPGMSACTKAPQLAANRSLRSRRERLQGPLFCHLIVNARPPVALGWCVNAISARR